MIPLAVVLSIAVLAYVLAILFLVGPDHVRKVLRESVAGRNFGRDRVEFNRMEEDIAVMRNLLMDMIENEALILGPLDGPLEDRIHRIYVQNQRRREIVGEAIVVVKRNPPHRQATRRKTAERLYGTDS